MAWSGSMERDQDSIVIFNEELVMPLVIPTSALVAGTERTSGWIS